MADPFFKKFKTRARTSQRWRVGQPPDPQKTFSEQANRLSDNDSDNDRWLQGTSPHLIINALYLEHLE